MKNIEEQYLQTINFILNNGTKIPNRTGVDAITVPHIMLQHDMSVGFPLLTTKKMAWKTMKVELEGFINGITSKSWYKERGCHIWDEWCNPKKVPPGLSMEERKHFQLIEDDLGPVYGYQWRNFNGSGYDQLKNVVETLKSNPYDRRMVCSAYNPLQLQEQALPPCHILFHLTVIENKLHLCWFQRSCDYGAGIPFNVASYGLLLHLLAKESGLEEGMLTGFLSNVHIYENHKEQLLEQFNRTPFELPKIETKDFSSVFEWKHTDTQLLNYQSHEKIELPIAV